MIQAFKSELWGNSVEVTPLPAFIFTDDRMPALTVAEFCVYVVACDAAKQAKQNCSFCLSIFEIQKRTGYSKKAAVTTALKGLREKGYISPLGKREHRKPQAYELLNPATGDRLASEHKDQRRWVNLRGALVRDGLRYFWIPTDAVKRLPELPKRVFAVLLGVARLAALQGKNFEVESSVLRFLCGLDHEAFSRAVGEAEERWVQVGFTDTTHRQVSVILLDPATGDSLEISELERQEREREEREKRFKDNRERNGRNSPVQLLAWALWAFGDLRQHGGSGECVTFCTTCHNVRKNRPGMFVNVFKGTHGVYRCFECGTGGNLLTLIRQHMGGFNTAIAKLTSIESEHPELVQQAAHMLTNYDTDGRYWAA